MEVKEKIDVLKRAITLLSVRGIHQGICMSIVDVLETRYGRYSIPFDYMNLSYYGISMPGDIRMYEPYWWPTTEEGKQERIRVIEEAIERLKKDL